ncbi:TPA: hypothetical protein ACH3X3_001964 [Trebouxia sp. C0006]
MTTDDRIGHSGLHSLSQPIQGHSQAVFDQLEHSYCLQSGQTLLLKQLDFCWQSHASVTRVSVTR